MRVVERAAEQEPRNGIQVGRERLAPEPHRLQRNRAATREGIENAGCPATERLSDPRPQAVEFQAVLSSPVETAPLGLLEVRILPAALELLGDQAAGNALAQAAARIRAAGVRQQGCQ